MDVPLIGYILCSVEPSARLSIACESKFSGATGDYVILSVLHPTWIKDDFQSSNSRSLRRHFILSLAIPASTASPDSAVPRKSECLLVRLSANLPCFGWCDHLINNVNAQILCLLNEVKSLAPPNFLR